MVRERKEVHKPHPNFQFFYLEDYNANPIGHVRVRQLAADIQRGVKRLPDYAFMDHWGSTQSSMRFMNAVRKLINVQNANRAVLTQSHQHGPILTVYTRDGFEILFKGGLNGGFFGTGPRGAYDVLKVCGFSEAQCQKVWHNETFTVIKRQ